MGFSLIRVLGSQQICVHFNTRAASFFFGVVLWPPNVQCETKSLGLKMHQEDFVSLLQLVHLSNIYRGRSMFQVNTQPHNS